VPTFSDRGCHGVSFLFIICILLILLFLLYYFYCFYYFYFYPNVCSPVTTTPSATWGQTSLLASPSTRRLARGTAWSAHLVLVVTPAGTPVRQNCFLSISFSLTPFSIFIFPRPCFIHSILSLSLSYLDSFWKSLAQWPEGLAGCARREWQGNELLAVCEFWEPLSEIRLLYFPLFEFRDSDSRYCEFRFISLS
jgi:hypothetical protein